ncbi:MAG: hypothetical protein WCD44_00580, partial [Candidatus Babeliales bacterium]
IEQSSPRQLLSSDQREQLEKQIKQWTEDYLSQLEPQQLQLMANITYLLFANTLCEQIIRIYSPALVLSTQKIQEKLGLGQDPMQEMALLKVLTEKLQPLSNKRGTFNQALQETNNYLNNNKQTQLVQEISPALQALQVNSQQLLQIYANNVQSEINNYMTTAAESLTNVVKTLNTAINLFQQPEELSTMLPDTLPSNQELAKLEVVNKVAQGLTACGWDNLVIAQNTGQYLTQLLRISQLFYGSYYYEVYNYIKTKDGNMTYQTQMFDEKGLIPTEYRTTPLPSPQEVVEELSS